MVTRKRALIFVLERVAITDECWYWTGQIDKYGYGKASIGDLGGRPAHRIAYALWKGPIKRGNEVHHKETCSTRSCINPEHLEQMPKTQHKRLHDSRNVVDGVRVCLQCGTPITGDNAASNGKHNLPRCKRCNRRRRR